MRNRISDEMKVDILEQVSVLADIDIATQPNDELSTDTTTKAEKTVTPPRYGKETTVNFVI